ncbi:MAG: signal peptidase II [Actinomycetales bacterium]|nr:signal peptidase II [Actinomycetales bacterium]
MAAARDPLAGADPAAPDPMAGAGPAAPDPMAGAGQPDPPARWRVIVTVAAVVLVLDVLTKIWAVARLEGRPEIVLVPALLGEQVGPLLRLTFWRNPGAAFGLGASAGLTLLFSVLAVAVAIGILGYGRRVTNLAWAFALGGLLGGALGNLVDRVFRSPGPLRGHVVDFLGLPHFPIFNVADSAVTCSAVAIVILGILGVAPTWRR